MITAILGLGTVGSGVWDVLHENQMQIRQYLGEAVEVRYVLDIRDLVGHPAQAVRVTDFGVVLKDPEVSIVMECMGGLHPAYDFVKAALKAGKSVVTSNKELIAACGTELMETACCHGADLLFEASVGGGIPVIRTLRESLAQEQILSVEGILNGTTNYILTRMEKENKPYEEILADAQALGYAERNPEADVMGYDACRKIAILASLTWKQAVDYRTIPTEGITSITLEQIREAAAAGKKIRLIASATLQDGRVEARVAPERISLEHPLASVSGVFNAVRIRGNMVGDILLQGQGAGKEATASAVVSDVLEAAKNRKYHIYGPVCWK